MSERLQLAPYQVLMRDFILKHERAAIFASMGCRKTSSTLAALNDLFADGAIGRALVIAPLRVAKLTWVNEAQRWDQFHWMKVGYLDPKSAVTTINPERVSELTTLEPFDVVVLDELTRWKSDTSARVHHLWKLLKERPQIRRIGLTGTPRPNSLLELHSQVRMLDDGKRLSPSFNHFRSAYFTPRDYLEYQWDPKPDSERKIYEKISDICLTLRASDYQNVPDMIVEDIEIALPKDAHSHYRVLERELVLLLQDEAVVARNAAVLVGKLLQVCSGAVYSETREVVQIHHGKITALKRLLLDRCEGENCIIFTNFIHERQNVLKSLGSDAVDVSTLKGDVEKLWNAGQIKYLVADPRSLGHGLNLQKGGRTVIWLSPTHSRELYDQANARVARDGQKLESRIFRIVCSGTLEEAVLETLRVRGDEQTEMMSILAGFQKMGRIFS